MIDKTYINTISAGSFYPKSVINLLRNGADPRLKVEGRTFLTMIAKNIDYEGKWDVYKDILFASLRTGRMNAKDLTIEFSNYMSNVPPSKVDNSIIETYLKAGVNPTEVHFAALQFFPDSIDSEVNFFNWFVRYCTYENQIHFLDLWINEGSVTKKDLSKAIDQLTSPRKIISSPELLKFMIDAHRAAPRAISSKEMQQFIAGKMSNCDITLIASRSGAQEDLLGFLHRLSPEERVNILQTIQTPNTPLRQFIAAQRKGWIFFQEDKECCGLIELSGSVAHELSALL